MILSRNKLVCTDCGTSKRLCNVYLPWIIRHKHGKPFLKRLPDRINEDRKRRAMEVFAAIGGSR